MYSFHCQWFKILIKDNQNAQPSESWHLFYVYNILFSSTQNTDTGGIYIFTGANGKTGDNWERPVSAELIVPDSAEGFQVNCGMQIQGGASRLAEKKLS